MSDFRKIISKIATAYMHRAERIIMINATCLINLLYRSSRKQIETETTRIVMLNSDNLHLLKQYISPNELEKKYGGNKPNLIKFWPIQTTNSEVMSKRKKLK